MMTGKVLSQLLQSAASRWSDRDAPRLGAALAFYTLLSLAPLLVLMVAICGVVFKKQAESDLLQQVSLIAGSSSAKTIEMLLGSAHHANGTLATTIALLALLFGASGVFIELKDSLNIIWDAPPRPGSTWKTMIWQRLISFGMILALGFLLLVSLILSAAVTMVENFVGPLMPIHLGVFSQVGNFIVSLIAVAVLFALIFKFVPDVSIHWRDVAIGAIATAVLFSIGKELLAFYLGTAAVGSTYGAAGSLVALIVWVYYSAQIFFFGAVFTRVYADSLGSQAAKKDRALAAIASAAAGLKRQI